MQRCDKLSVPVRDVQRIQANENEKYLLHQKKYQ